MISKEDAIKMEIEFKRICATVVARPPFDGRYIVRVFVGGYDSEQDIPFYAAVNSLGGSFNPRKFDFQYKFIKDVGDQQWGARDLVNWLLASHVHFIICHPHQGLEDMCWYMDDLYKQILRLFYHPGFPTGDQLRCPIFTQDKIRYIKALQPVGWCTPTFACYLIVSKDNSESYYSEECLMQLDM